MRHFIPFLAGSSITLVLIAGACGSSTTGTGASTATSSHATTSSHASTSGSTNSTTNSTTSNTVSSANSTTVSSTSGGGSGLGGAGVGGSGAGGGTGGTAPDPFACTVSANPSGSCVTVTGPDAGAGGSMAGVQCNPVTNEGCAAGDDCDVSTDSNGNVIGFFCYNPVGTAALCATCDDTTTATTCVNGATCFGYGNDQFSCAQYCCSDADCGTGKCTTMTSQGAFFPIAPALGVCTLM